MLEEQAPWVGSPRDGGAPDAGGRDARSHGAQRALMWRNAESAQHHLEARKAAVPVVRLPRHGADGCAEEASPPSTAARRAGGRERAAGCCAGLTHLMDVRDPWSQPFEARRQAHAGSRQRDTQERCASCDDYYSRLINSRSAAFLPVGGENRHTLFLVGAAFFVVSMRCPGELTALNCLNR